MCGRCRIRSPVRVLRHPFFYPAQRAGPTVLLSTCVKSSYIPAPPTPISLAINEAAQELAENWLICAVELAVSQSAAIAGSLVEYDYQRALNNLAVVRVP